MLAWLYLRFDGRIGRGVYWASSIATFLVVTVVMNVILSNFGLYDIDVADETALSAVMSRAEPWFDVVVLVLLWPTLAVQTKRWHDRGKSGWWNLIGLIPFIGTLWAFIELGFLRGTPGPNRYGSDPVRPRAGGG